MAAAVILSILCGMTVVLGRIFNAQLGVRAGMKFSTLMNFTVGLGATLAVILFSGNIWENPFPQDIPFVYYLSGVVAIGGVLMGAWASARASGMQMTLVIFVSQLFAGMVLDAFFLHKFSPGQLVGGLIVLAGVVLNVLGDKEAREGKK